MVWIFAVAVVLLLGAIAAVASGKGEPLAIEYDDRPDALVPANRTLEGSDLRRVRFSLALRGYRMSEVDALLDRLANQLDHTDRPGESDGAPAYESGNESQQ